MTPEVRSAYLNWAQKTVVQELRRNNQDVPAKCLAEVQQHDGVRTAMFGSVFPPDPSILQNYAQLREQLPADLMSKYRSLAIAMAVSKRIKGVETSDESKNIGRDYQPGFWGNDSLQTPASAEERDFIHYLADFMTESHVSAGDLYQDASLQERLRVFLGQHQVSSKFIDEVHKSVPFGECLKNAMVLLGQRPAARDPKPSTIVWMSHLAALNTSTPSSTPDQDGKPMPWPLFPIDMAPWPLLMPLAHPIPLSEADYIWEAFQGEHGPDRYHTYGPYRGDDDVMPDSLKPSKWFWDAWPDRIIHGGECVPISKGTVDLYSGLNKPAMWSGQPGHANLITFQYVDSAWTAEIEQPFAGGPDVTSAQWYFDEDPGTQIHFRDLYYWPGAEYHLGVALAMNIGLKSYIDTRMAANIFRAMPSEAKRTLGVRLLRNTLQVNPFNPEIWYRLAEQTPDAMQDLMLIEAAAKGDPALIDGHPGNGFPAKSGTNTASDQYWRTLAEFVTQFGLLSHPAAHGEEDRRRIYDYLKTVPGISAIDLASYAGKFTENNVAHANADAVDYDQKLAEAGDSYGQLRMGQRYSDGSGVSQSDDKAQELLASAASQGDVAAATILERMNPSIPADQVTVKGSSEYSQTQQAKHLVDGAGMTGVIHDNEQGAGTMWQTALHLEATSPVAGLAPSPAWVRFDFDHPVRFASLLIWNHNQPTLTDRGFRRTRIYGSADGATWISLTSSNVIEVPRANGGPSALPSIIPNDSPEQPLKSVIIAAEVEGGNYGGDCYGLSAVRFGVPRLPHVLPADMIAVTASSVYSPLQAPQHLVDGSGMLGALHDNAEAAQTMWHTLDGPVAKAPASGLPLSPGWVKFHFTKPQKVDAILIWNHNQATLTDRGFRKARIYGSSDGATWRPLTRNETIELPRATGSPIDGPTSIPNVLASQPLKSIIIAAEDVNGNYGGSCFGLSAVRFVTSR
ncbi:hypothetical protein CCAX7_65830 [Capsulimonas corticalis]|uniref:Uncharacterized protein n=1 Tax=Capsulimonas corticalis TaxID=2219043 RepID=A0A402CR87_9BACT|nr:hypothetical protein CCAX7_65830 [Capsulimonas corticalis]